MQQGRQNRPELLSLEQATKRIDDVLSGIRVPDLPYPVGKLDKDAISDWTPLLMSCWTEQRDEPVTHVLRSVSLTWSVRQINAAYVSDRIMDVFLKSSGLHPELARRIARLRFFLAWRMNLEGADVFSDTLLEWLDSLQDLRGWSNSGGRSAKILLDQLDSLTIEVSGCFEHGDKEPVMAFCRQWKEDAEKREQQTGRLRERLLKTEQGAARQRRAEHTARALIGRAMKGRQLPEPVVSFVMNTWFGLLKQIVWEEGLDGENWRHASKLLEWLVWIGDPTLSDRDRNRLYTVGEQIGDRIIDVWNRLNKEPLPEQALAGIQDVMVQRLRGETPELMSALPPPDRFSWDSAWLALEPVPESEYQEMKHTWYVEGEGAKEQRRFFLALLEDTREVLWTNGAGVRLGLQPWTRFKAEFENGHLRRLPPVRPFGEVLAETMTALSSVLHRQMVQRKKAAEDARQRAEKLRHEKEEAEKQRAEERAAKEAAIEKQRQEAEARRQADEEAEAERLRVEKEAAARTLVEGIKLGGWIVVENSESPTEPQRLKLAVRINASRKLVFVDRLGLNRREFLEDELIEEVVGGRVRVLGASAEFDDTLSRVVGRIRVGR
ncbi:cell envelope integrity protein TolA [Marinobacter halotolerans]|uniref:cell envelope integrity protein TolA n=1 Tax=Marinobacter halotolerans TaxID=1569211 RepID=UPI0012462100|nr:cell envelope integrity protein TolA [Marinobacter halotolerans]